MKNVILTFAVALASLSVGASAQAYESSYTPYRSGYSSPSTSRTTSGSRYTPRTQVAPTAPETSYERPTPTTSSDSTAEFVEVVDSLSGLFDSFAGAASSFSDATDSVNELKSGSASSAFSAFTSIF